MPVPGEQPDLAALPPQTSPVKRRLAAQYVREARDRLTAGMYVPSEEMRSDATAVLEAALRATIACEPIEKKLRQAVKSGVVVPQAGQDTAQLARAKEVISADEYARWEEKEALRKTVIQVDDFPQDFGRAEFMARLEAESPRVAAKAA